MLNLFVQEAYIRMLADTYQLYQHWLCIGDELSSLQIQNIIRLVSVIEQALLKMSSEDRCLLFDEYFREPNERRCSCKRWNRATNEVKLQVMSSFFRCLRA